VARRCSKNGFLKAVQLVQASKQTRKTACKEEIWTQKRETCFLEEEDNREEKTLTNKQTNTMMWERFTC
jgi:hypothetical protein